MLCTCASTLKNISLTTPFTFQDGGPHGDLAVAVTLMERLRSRLRTEGLWSLFRQVEMPLTPVLAVMELQSIRVNVHTFIAFSEVLKVS